MWTPEPHKQVGTIVVQAGLIFLGAEHVVGPLRLNLPGNVYLTSHGINGDRSSSEMEHVEPLGQRRDLVGFIVCFKLYWHYLIGRSPGVHNVNGAFPSCTVEGPPDGFPIKGDDVLTQVSKSLHLCDTGLLEARRVEHGKNAPKRIVGRNAMGQIQKPREPRGLGLPPGGNFHPVLRSANRRENRNSEDRL